MLTRRHIRIKVMQALYAFFQTENADINRGEKELFNSIEKIYDLYLFLLSLIIEIQEVSARMLEEAKSKRLPTREDLQPNLRFTENQFINKLKSNRELIKQTSGRKILWQNEQELIKGIFLKIREASYYKNYMALESTGFKEDRDLVEEIYKNNIFDNELLLHFFEEKSIYWMDDFYLVEMAIINTIQSFKPESDDFFPLIQLYREKEEDSAFAKELYRKTILHNKEFEKLIGDQTKNWDVERIAMMDVLLMKMALCEFLNFNYIPVKVTMNEYIEISKNYSSPKSKQFINGILDKLVLDLKTSGAIKKTGRGLIE